MDVSSVQRNSEMGRNSSPKQCTSEEKLDFVLNCTPVEQKVETSEDFQKASAELSVEESISISVKHVGPREDSTEHSNFEQLAQDITLSSLEPVELQAQRLSTEISSPEQLARDTTLSRLELNTKLSSPKQRTPVEHKLEAVDGLQKASARARLEEAVSVSVKQLGSSKDSTEISNCEQLAQDITLNIPEPLGLQVESVNAKISSAKQPTLVEQKLETDEDLRISSTEAAVEESVSVSVKQLGPTEDSTKNLNCEQVAKDANLSSLVPMQLQAERVKTKISSPEPLAQGTETLELQAECVIVKFSKPEQTKSDQNYEFGSENVNDEPMQENQVIATEDAEDRRTENRKSECDHISIELKGKLPEKASGNPCVEPSTLLVDDWTRNCSLDKLKLPSGDAATDCNLMQLEPQPDDVSKNLGLKEVGPAQENAARSSSEVGQQVRRPRGRPRKGENSLTSSLGSTRLLPEKGKDIPSSSVGSTRLLRSRSQEKSKTPYQINNLTEEGVDIEKKRNKKKRRMEKSPVNEFSRIRTHLRYLLHRIKYEQNFIDAYSGEGWKGQSLEKIKPEKELRRATSEIFRRKLKIRDLFKRLDLSCSEGRLPEVLFDSKGEIDSEDIFCAKCGSKDVEVNNDIILCDGGCERGFHQFCLEPPLLKENIPPGDEGWLCPGCECKFDCMNLINISLGAKLSVRDSWEKVFPEEAAAAAAVAVAVAASGNKLDDDFGLPSDDSGDDDYDPDGPELDEKVRGDESGSNESNYYSASDEPNHEQNTGLPLEDSEDDDDFDPSGLDPERELQKESSGSDFTSDSEDFSVAFDHDELSGEVHGPTMSILDHNKSNEERHSEMNRQSLGEELLSGLDSDPGRGDSTSLYSKRRVERLDYKKLHDEEFGNASSNSSDEDYVDAAFPKRRKNNSGKAASLSPNEETPVTNESESSPKQRTSKRSDVEGADSSSPSKSRKPSSAPGSSGKGTRATYTEDVTQRLYDYFKENQYPVRAIKENLAKELALTVQQVSKWFENARWSSRHSSHMESIKSSGSSEKQQNPV